MTAFPWARAELTRAFSSSGFRRLRFPTGVGHLNHILICGDYLIPPFIVPLVRWKISLAPAEIFKMISSISSSLNDRFPWARAELTRAFSSSGFRRLRFPTGVGHLIHYL